eukprot:2495955-Pleurochrysis_carterae.AAC.1
MKVAPATSGDSESASEMSSSEHGHRQNRVGHVQVRVAHARVVRVEHAPRRDAHHALGVGAVDVIGGRGDRPRDGGEAAERRADVWRSKVERTPPPMPARAS